VLNDRLNSDVCRNGTHSSGTDDDRVLRALVRNEMCWLIAFSGDFTTDFFNINLYSLRYVYYVAWCP